MLASRHTTALSYIYITEYIAYIKHLNSLIGIVGFITYICVIERTFMRTYVRAPTHICAHTHLLYRLAY